MTVPRADEYQAAVQSPRIAFVDPDLSHARVATDSLGLPRVASGSFVLTYRLDTPGHSWAVRCFHREVPNLQRRYQAISDFFVTHPSPIFVPVSYARDGIRVSGRFYPIIKMPWIQGDPIGVYVDAHLRTPTLIQPLAEKFRALAQELARLGAAHGDLQHGNIVVENGHLRLIDYDGFFVPKLQGLEAGDLGHVNYQHPRRVITDFGPHLDRFSTIVIYLALRATALQPGLWHKYATGENILFSQADFLDPTHSRLLLDIAKIPELEQYAQPFRQVCSLDLSKVPLLDDFLAGKNVSLRRSPLTRVAGVHQQPASSPGAVHPTPSWVTPPAVTPTKGRNQNQIPSVGAPPQKTSAPTPRVSPTPKPSVDDTLSALYGNQPITSSPRRRSVTPPVRPPTPPFKAGPRPFAARSRKKAEPPISFAGAVLWLLRRMIHWLLFSGILTTIAFFLLALVLVGAVSLAVGLGLLAGWIP